MKIDELRKRIDCTDRQIFALLDERMETVKLIGEEKILKGILTDDEKREAEIMTAISDSVSNVNAVQSIYERIFEASKEIQRALKTDVKS